MEFRRTTQRDGRRRRALIDESGAGDTDNATTDGDGGGKKTAARRYGDQARPENQPRITEFIPVNVWLICGLFTLIAMSIVGIEALHYQTQLRLADHSSSNAQIAPAETSQTPADAPNAGVAVNAVSDDDQVIEKSSIAKSDLSAVNLSAVDVTKFGSLASTMGGGILLAAAICGLLIYRLRKHKNDDYTGTYRVWIWVPAVLLLVALEQQTGISQAIVGWLGHFGFAEYLAPELSVGTIATSLLLAGLTIRLLFEMREWRLGTGLLLTTASLYVITLLTQLQIIQLSNLLHQQILASTLLLTAHTSTLLTAIFYQRFVYLDSQGKIVIPVREPRAAKRKRGEKTDEELAAEAALQAKKRKRSDLDNPPPAVEPAKPAQPKKVAKKSAPLKRVMAAESDSEDDDEEDGLSRAERRRIRKQKRRNRDAA